GSSHCSWASFRVDAPSPGFVITLIVTTVVARHSLRVVKIGTFGTSEKESSSGPDLVASPHTSRRLRRNSKNRTNPGRPTHDQANASGHTRDCGDIDDVSQRHRDNASLHGEVKICLASTECAPLNHSDTDF